MKRILFVSNHAGFIKFNQPYIDWLRHQGFIVDNISPGIDDEYKQCPTNHYDVAINRNPFSLINVRAIIETRKILKRNNYDLLHCHTPMGSVIARIAAIGLPAKILYTVHGYHFFKNGPISGWLIYYPIERLLAYKTDYLVTINNEDFHFAQRRFMSKNPPYKINGVGFKNAFSPVSYIERVKLRSEFGFEEKDFIVLYTAQFIKRKNHKFIISCLPDLLQYIPNLKIVFVGSGELIETIKTDVNNKNWSENVVFMGGRRDVYKFCQLADLYVSASFQEGLCVSNLEAMACGLPLVLTNIRGQNDVCEDGINGFLYEINDRKKFIESIVYLYNNQDHARRMSTNNIELVEKFSIRKSLDSMISIYKEILRF